MRSIAIGLLFTGAFLTHLNAQAPAARFHSLAQIGGDGGSQFADDCPDGAVVTGLALHVGDDVDAVQMLCLGRDLSRKIDTPFHGGPGGGKLAVLSCPPATPALIALDIAAEGEKTIIVNNLHIYCGIIGNNASPPKIPDAVFDGPPVKSHTVLWGPFSPAPVSGHQACQPDEVAIGIHGSSGVWLDAIGLICGQVSRAVPHTAPTGNVVGRINTGTRPPATRSNNICDSAAAARARHSPAAPYLEAQCKAAAIPLAERADLTPGPNGVPVSVCDAAQAALDRLAPEANDLVSKCRAAGGGQNLISLAERYSIDGGAASLRDPLLRTFRNHQPSDSILGFDIGVGAAGQQTEWGPGKQRILDSLPPAEQDAFKIAVSFVLDRNRNAAMAAKGAAIAAADVEVGAARQRNPDVRYWLGFDIASALFASQAAGGEGHTSTGSGSDAIRDKLSLPAQQGFNASVQFHLSRRH